MEYLKRNYKKYQLSKDEKSKNVELTQQFVKSQEYF